MIGAECLRLEGEERKTGEYNQCNHFLKDFKLPKVVRTAIAGKSVFIGWNLEAVFEKGNSPTDDDDCKKA